MLLVWFIGLFCEIIEDCELPDTDRIMLSKYYKPLCPYSKKIEPIIDELDSVLERNNLDVLFRYVDCSRCKCSSKNIKTVPTLIIDQNGKEKDRFVGSAGFNEYIDFIIKNTGINEKVFYNYKKSMPGKVVKLKEMDFDDGFDGPWIVMFYSDKDKIMKTLLSEIAQSYKGRLNVAEIESKRSEKIRKKINIPNTPSLFGIYKGIFVKYTGKKKIDRLKAFVDKLIGPSFELIDNERFKSEIKNLERGEPMFVVFYSDLSLANYYFKRVAHEYKFKTRMFKTKDESLFEIAGVWPRNVVDGKESVSDEEKVILTVYKDRMFHTCPHKLSEVKAISEWIFLSHFPHLTRITSDNFFTVFHGLKPLALLLTRNDEFVEDLERLSASQHIGLPYSEYTFATIDLDQFPLLVTKLLPKINQSVMVIYDPLKQLFYYKNMKLTAEDFEMNTIKFLKDFEAGKVPSYPQNKNHMVWYIASAIFVIGALYTLLKFSTHKKTD